MGLGGFRVNVVQTAQLQGEHGTDRYQGRLELGTFDLNHMPNLRDYADAALDYVDSANQDRFGSSNCQDWCLVVINLLEDGGWLSQGTETDARRTARK